MLVNHQATPPLRVVSRSTLEPLYEKLWQRTGIKGDLAAVIGPA